MDEDDFGFRRPTVDAAACVGCGRCERVCPALSCGKEDDVQTVYWAKAKDTELLCNSSSGGVFGILARSVIASGGIVCGAAWEPGCKRLRHVLIESEKDLDAVMRSKYLQSSVGREVYEGVRDALRADREVLFCGTACQVAGMRFYLGPLANSDKLLLVDVICHGVPSPLLWRRWLAWKENRLQGNVVDVNFRSKHSGWKSFSVAYDYTTQVSEGIHKDSCVFSDDWFMKAFLANASLRSSCLACPAKRRCGSDITLGDYWGVWNKQPEAFDDQGVSAVLCNTSRGREAIASIIEELDLGESAFESIAAGNIALVRSVKPYVQRDQFLQALAKDVSVTRMMCRWSFRPSRARRLYKKAIIWMRRLLVPVKEDG